MFRQLSFKTKLNLQGENHETRINALGSYFDCLDTDWLRYRFFVSAKHFIKLHAHGHDGRQGDDGDVYVAYESNDARNAAETYGHDAETPSDDGPENEAKAA